MNLKDKKEEVLEKVYECLTKNSAFVIYFALEDEKKGGIISSLENPKSRELLIEKLEALRKVEKEVINTYER